MLVQHKPQNFATKLLLNPVFKSMYVYGCVLSCLYRKLTTNDDPLSVVEQK